jgi:bisphosphoglycerate-independent phosphoglycerate mutase (AlkP superfamily)
MQSFKEFIREINDNAKEELPKSDPADVRRRYLSLHNKKRNEWEEKQYQALKDHPALKEGYNAKPAVSVDLTVKDVAKDAVAVDQTVKPKKQKPIKTAPMTPIE